MSPPGVEFIPTELLAQVAGGTRMCTSGTSDDDLTNTMMEMMQMMQQSLQSLGSNNGSSSMMTMLPMMMMMKNRG
jgi:hypothetical protein